MCWIERQENVNIQITDKDIEVYKVVFEASKQSCKSCVFSFIYEANILYKIPSIQLKKGYAYEANWFSNIIYVERAYHSYTKIQHTLRKIKVEDLVHKYKGIIVGNQLISLPINNSYYITTFIIPKGSQYAVNWQGEIISNKIIYTGKCLKL
jgi:hypothetical protein